MEMISSLEILSTLPQYTTHPHIFQITSMKSSNCASSGGNGDGVQNYPHHKVLDEMLNFSFGNETYLPVKRRSKLNGSVQLESSLVSISNIVLFAKKSGFFLGKLTFENQDQFLPLGYKVVPVSNTPSQFFIKPTHGFLHPKQKAEVLVISKRNDLEFQELFSTKGFLLLATPIYFRSQLNVNSIKVLWKAFGTSLFPRDAAEVHLIDRILPLDDIYMDSCSYIERAVLGNLLQMKTFSEIRSATRGKGIDKVTFYSNWGPFEEEGEMSGYLDAQLRQVIAMTRTLKREMKETSNTTKLVVIIIFTLFFSTIYMFPLYNSLANPNKRHLAA